MFISIAFPDMMNPQHANFVMGKDAIHQGLFLLLNTPVGELGADPTYGCNARARLFEPNTPATEIMLIEDIFQAIRTYASYVAVKRDDIKVTRPSKGKVEVEIFGLSLIDYQTNMYNISITQ
jgi:phage baseplate assembly protein W